MWLFADVLQHLSRLWTILWQGTFYIFDFVCKWLSELFYAEKQHTNIIIIVRVQLWVGWNSFPCMPLSITAGSPKFHLFRGSSCSFSFLLSKFFLLLFALQPGTGKNTSGQGLRQGSLLATQELLTWGYLRVFNPKLNWGPELKSMASSHIQGRKSAVPFQKWTVWDPVTWW